MKALILALLMTLTCEGRELIWSDEFNGTELDKSKWNIVTTKRHEGQNCYESVIVKDGELQIHTFTKNGQHFTGMVDTEGKYESAYGYWEMRVKFNDQPGTWSDAWMYSQTVASVVGDLNKSGQEIDIFEHRQFDPKGKDISKILSHVLHWDGYDKDHKCMATDAPIEANSWHIIGFEWTQGGYKWFIDGKMTWSAKPTTSKPLFFIFSTEVGYLDFWTLPPPKEGYDHVTLSVDYVRHYR